MTLLPDEKLFAACSSGDVLAMRSALVEGASVHTSRKGTLDRPIHVAAAFDRRAVVLELLTAGADPNAQNIEGRTPLYEAAYLRTPDVWNLLIDHGARADICANTGLSAQQVRDTLDQANAMVAFSQREAGLDLDRSRGH